MANKNIIADKLDDCIEQHLDAMAGYDVGSEAMTNAINDLVKLYKFRIDEGKLDFDYDDKNDRHDLDKQRVDNDKSFREQQFKLDERKFELDRTDRTEQREIERKRANLDATYKKEQLDLEARKVDLDATDKSERRNLDKRRLVNDRANGREQIKEQRTDRYFRIGMATAELVLPLVVYTALAMLGYAREFDGVITSATLKRVTNDIFDFKLYQLEVYYG